MKKVISIILVIMILLLSCISASAATSSHSVCYIGEELKLSEIDDTFAFRISIMGNSVTYLLPLGLQEFFRSVFYEGLDVRFICGDANGDGLVNIRDATIIQQHLVKLKNISEDESLLAADVDLSNEITIKDATAIQKHICNMCNDTN